jgi:hypothetical protein
MCKRGRRSSGKNFYNNSGRANNSADELTAAFCCGSATYGKEDECIEINKRKGRLSSTSSLFPIAKLFVVCALWQFTLISKGVGSNPFLTSCKTSICKIVGMTTI